MATPTAQDIAAEYKRILDEGYSPDLDEFLRHVPEDLQDASRTCIEELLAELESAMDETVMDEAILDETDTSTELVAAVEPAAPVAIETFEDGPVVFDLDDGSLLEEPVAGEPEVAEEPEVVEEPEVAEEPARTGPVKISKKEAKAMFAAMDAAKKAREED